MSSWWLLYLSKSNGANHKIGNLFLIFNHYTNTTIYFFLIFSCRPVLNTHYLRYEEKIGCCNLNNFCEIDIDTSMKLSIHNCSFKINQLTRMKSKVLVTITIQEHLSCQTILQKSPIVFSVGPWVTIYALGWTRLWN